MKITGESEGGVRPNEKERGQQGYTSSVERR
jgi:hypothetical protein